MKILLIVSSFNSLSQSVYVKLKDLGHIISVQYATSDEDMICEVKSFEPDIILCPYLKKFIPKEIFNSHSTFILHPGIRGDRGHHSLDHAVREKKKQWGIVILKANEKFDGGDIYAEANFEVRDTYKASLYRTEVVSATLDAVNQLLINLEDKNFTPIPQIESDMHHYLSDSDRAIDWQNDTTEQIVNKIYQSDSYPGVKDNILGVDCYLYGAWEEEKLKGDIKEILVKRDGAICLGTKDGAIWISHLKEVGGFKLPATYVLKDKIKGVKEDRLPLIFDMSYKTFYEIGSHRDGDVAYLCFNFHNGAMSSDQAIKLKYAFEYLCESAKVIVLIGSRDFFSNGIHLNILEDSKKQGEDGWSNINAMNDVIKSIIYSNVITVASLHRNAGAGGVGLATACDYVVGREGVVLNPHYKTMGLSGSEYHTYSIPKRVGEQKAKELTSKYLPISIEHGEDIGLIDEVFEDKDYFEKLREYASALLEDEDRYDEFIWDKEDYLEEHKEYIESCKDKELKTMYPEFWDEDSEFHQLRADFVRKVASEETPQRLKYKG